MIAHVQAVGLREARGRFAMAGPALVRHQLEEAEVLARSLTMLFRGHAPHRSGAFANGLDAKVLPTSPAGFTIELRTSNPDLRTWLKEGTGIYGPHQSPVVPVHAKFLRWTDGGGVHFARSVRGMRANPWEERAQEEALPLAQAMANRVAVRTELALA